MYSCFYIAHLVHKAANILITKMEHKCICTDPQFQETVDHMRLLISVDSRCKLTVKISTVVCENEAAVGHSQVFTD